MHLLHVNACTIENLNFYYKIIMPETNFKRKLKAKPLDSKEFRDQFIFSIEKI
jgi:hypothetical protein